MNINVQAPKMERDEKEEERVWGWKEDKFQNIEIIAIVIKLNCYDSLIFENEMSQ